LLREFYADHNQLTSLPERLPCWRSLMSLTTS
jgi:hypothetical protein